MMSRGHSTIVRKYHILPVPLDSLLDWTFDAQADNRLACELSAFRMKKLAFSFANNTCQIGPAELNNDTDAQKRQKNEQDIMMRGML